MQIKTADGTENVASAGVGGAGLGLGIAGTVLGLLQNGSFGGILGGNCQSQVATKTDLAYVQELGKNDSEIALLKSEQHTEVKIADVYDRLVTKINANEKEQTAFNSAQAVVNAQMGANIAVNANNIAQLQTLCGNLTKTIIPIDNVCPEPMKRYNNWTAPTTTTTGG